MYLWKIDLLKFNNLYVSFLQPQAGGEHFPHVLGIMLIFVKKEKKKFFKLTAILEDFRIFTMNQSCRYSDIPVKISGSFIIVLFPIRSSCNM